MIFFGKLFQSFIIHSININSKIKVAEILVRILFITT